jgi:hypothetical protein
VFLAFNEIKVQVLVSELKNLQVLHNCQIAQMGHAQSLFIQKYILLQSSGGPDISSKNATLLKKKILLM